MWGVRAHNYRGGRGHRGGRGYRGSEQEFLSKTGRIISVYYHTGLIIIWGGGGTEGGAGTGFSEQDFLTKNWENSVRNSGDFSWNCAHFRGELFAVSGTIFRGELGEFPPLKRADNRPEWRGSAGADPPRRH